MGSFKLKLFLWFALLALLPLAVAFYGYDSLAKRSETRRVDAGLQSSLRAAVAGYQGRLDAASAQAAQLAADPQLQRALRGRDVATLRRVVARVPGASVSSARPPRRVDRLPGRGSLRQGDHRRWCRARPRLGPRPGRPTPARSPRHHPLARGRARRDPRRAGDRGPWPRAATRGVRRPADTRAGRVGVLPSACDRVVRPAEGASRSSRSHPRPRSTPLPASPSGASCLVLAGSLALIGIVTYLLGRSIVRTLRRLSRRRQRDSRAVTSSERVEVRGRDEFADLASAFNGMAAQLQQRLVELETERTRVRDAAARFGEALVATHDSTQLLQVIVETAVEATGADGGLVLGREGELVRIGDPEAPGERIAFPLRAGASDFGSLVITAPTFDADQVETAASLAAQAVVALENARLHRIVERQALVRQPDRAREPATARGDPALRARPCRTLPRPGLRRDRRPRRFQARQRHVRPRRRRRGAEGVRARAASRPCARATSPGAGAARSSCSCSRGRTRRAARGSPSARGRRSSPSRSRLRTGTRSR